MLVTLSWSNEIIQGVSTTSQNTASSYVGSAAIVGAFIAAAWCWRPFEALLASPKAPKIALALGVAALVGRALATFAPAGAAWMTLAYAGLAAHAVCESLLLLALFCLVSRQVFRRIEVLFPVAYALAAAVHFALRALPVSLAAAVIAALPVLAAICVALLTGRLRPPALADTEGTEDADAPVEPERPLPNGGPDSSAATAAWSFPVRPVVLMVAYNFAFYFSLALSSGPNPYGPFGMLAVSLVAAVVPLVAPRSYAPSFLYRLALPLMIAGLMFLAFLGEGRTAAVMFGNSGNVAFMLFMYITLSRLCQRYGISPVWMFGIVCAFANIASTLGLPVGAAFTQAFPAGSETSRFAMCLIVLAVVVLSTVFFNDQAVARTFGMVPIVSARSQGDDAAHADGAAPASSVLAAMSYSERIVWQCSQVGRRFGLTQREQEVLELMVQGLSAAEIAERASVSYGTVKTHVNHIYRKLDVHTREEAVALTRRTGERE